MWKEAVSWQANLLGRDLNLQLFRASLLQTGDEFLALSEFGSFLRMNLSPEGWQKRKDPVVFRSRDLDFTCALERTSLHYAK